MSRVYQLRIRGRMSELLAAEFEQLGLTADGDMVETQFHGPVEDQAALYGLVRRLEALGLDLVELRACPDPVDPADGDRTPGFLRPGSQDL
jgi:hypothetical protein